MDMFCDELRRLMKHMPSQLEGFVFCGVIALNSGESSYGWITWRDWCEHLQVHPPKLNRSWIRQNSARQTKAYFTRTR
jgi:hypothetical protein